MKDHFLDNWATLKSSTQVAELFDNYVDVRKGSVNGHKKDILRDTGATIDLVCEKYINPSSFSGENVWVKQPLSPELVCLPWAVVEISGNFGTVQAKAAVCGNNLNQHGRYLLGNKTNELIKGNLGYNFLPIEIMNAVQTRSQVKAAREERRVHSGDAKKGEDEAIIVSSDAEDEILIPALSRNMTRFPVVRNRSELETRFFASPQKHNQQPSDFVYDLLKIHKILKLEMTEEKFIDHNSRLEPQILDYVEVKPPQTTSNLLQIIDKYEERFLNRKIKGSGWESRDIKPSENNRFPNRNRQEN
ncbi:uncharacterized protein TNCV_1682941 [Trichonephila clavipes]|nr:uncharacterized protein TNCV_1682941 [Trichonephila clavipes]